MIALEPGEKWSSKVELNTVAGSPFTLYPGEYEIHVVYHAKRHSLVKGATSDLKSNTVRIEVKR